MFGVRTASNCAHRFTFNMFVFNFTVLIKNNKNPIHSFYTYFKIDYSKQEIRGIIQYYALQRFGRSKLLRTQVYKFQLIFIITTTNVCGRSTNNPACTGGITIGIVQTLFLLVVHILLRQRTDYYFISFFYGMILF